jgi:hypothetical protein
MKASSLFLVLAACTNAGGGSTGTFSQEEASSAGQAMANGIEQSAAMYGPITMGLGADASCAAVSGDTSDPDGDHIPNNATLTYNCSASAFGLTGTLTGTLNAVDDQPGSIAWAFTGMADLQSAVTGPSSSVTASLSGKIVASQVSIAGPFALARTGDATTVFTTKTKTTTVDETDQWTITYTPMFQWTPGNLAITGSLSVSGTWDVTVDGGEAANAMLSTPTALTLTPSCKTRITAGSVVAGYMLNGQSNTITVTWTGCGQSSVTYANPEM